MHKYSLHNYTTGSIFDSIAFHRNLSIELRYEVCSACIPCDSILSTRRPQTSWSSSYRTEGRFANLEVELKKRQKLSKKLYIGRFYFAILKLFVHDLWSIFRCIFGFENFRTLYFSSLFF